jgi:G:T-mismatch repair DNA endonuclease (very short patch repair protein)
MNDDECKIRSEGETTHLGWRVLIIWKNAALRKSNRFEEVSKLEEAGSWLLSEGRFAILGENGFEECI